MIHDIVDMTSQRFEYTGEGLTIRGGVGNDTIWANKGNNMLIVFNPARIWRLPGTMNCKGDSIPNRPHSMANIVAVPDKIETVSRELLVAGEGMEQEQPTPPTVRTDSGFVLEKWILRHGLDVNRGRKGDAGRSG